MTVKYLSKHICKVLTIIVTMGLFISSAYVVKAEDTTPTTVPAPTNPTFDDEFYSLVSWDAPEGISENQIKNYNVILEYNGTEVANEYQSSTLTSHYFNYELMDNKDGKYRVGVQTVLMDDSTSEVTWSEPVNFYTVKYEFKTLDVDGDNINPGNTGGYVKYTINNVESSLTEVEEDEVYMMKEGTSLKVEAVGNPGYAFISYVIETGESSGGSTGSFNEVYECTVNQKTTIITTFQEDASTINIVFEFGENHKELAKQFADLIIEEEGDETMATVDGSRVTTKYLKASTTVRDVNNYFMDPIYSAISLRSSDPSKGPVDNEERLNGALTSNPSYSSRQEYKNAVEQLGTIPLTEGIVIYLHWDKKATIGDFTLEAPKCGDETSVTMGDKGPVVVNGPKLVATNSSHLEPSSVYSSNAAWMDEMDYETFFPALIEEDIFQGKFVGGTKYYALTPVEAKFGYYIPVERSEVEPIINPGNPDGLIPVESTIKVEYPEITVNGKKAFIPDADSTVDNTGNIFVVSEIDAVHNWSEWETVKEPTITEDGLKERVCSGCKEKETEVIPALGLYENTKGNNSTWTKGSTDNLEFVFKNNKDDTKTFGNFVGIKVDGKDVNEKDYTAVEGSVVINLKPSYLETLSVGKHTLTAIFEDGQSKSTFTIVEKSTPQSRTYVTPKTGVE